MSEKNNDFNPSSYMTKDECKESHKEKEKYYNEIINHSITDRKTLAGDLTVLDTKFDKYKEKINGKFDKIMYSIVFILLTLVASFGATIYIQVSTKNDMNNKFKTEIEGRTYHQAISQSNNKDLEIVLQRIDNLTSAIEKSYKKDGITK